MCRASPREQKGEKPRTATVTRRSRDVSQPDFRRTRSTEKPRTFQRRCRNTSFTSRKKLHPRLDRRQEGRLDYDDDVIVASRRVATRRELARSLDVPGFRKRAAASVIVVSPFVELVKTSAADAGARGGGERRGALSRRGSCDNIAAACH